MTDFANHLTTIDGAPASRLGLAGNPSTDPGWPHRAFDAGLNWFFFYNFTFEGMIEGVRRMLPGRRDSAIVSTGSESRDLSEVKDFMDQVCQRLSVDVVDVFFAAYLSPDDDVDGLLGEGGLFDLLHEWKRAGRIRYVGATAHNRPIAQKLVESGRIDVLMHRYNMAHRGAEEAVLPAAAAAGVPVVAFTCTRWGSLLKGHRDWSGAVPSAADCYAFALQNPAVRLALTAPGTDAELVENLSAVEFLGGIRREDRHDRWKEFGALVYGDGRDDFETQYP